MSLINVALPLRAPLITLPISFGVCGRRKRSNRASVSGRFGGLARQQGDLVLAQAALLDLDPEGAAEDQLLQRELDRVLGLGGARPLRGRGGRQCRAGSAWRPPSAATARSARRPPTRLLLRHRRRRLRPRRRRLPRRRRPHRRRRSRRRRPASTPESTAESTELATESSAASTAPPPASTASIPPTAESNMSAVPVKGSKPDAVVGHVDEVVVHAASEVVPAPVQLGQGRHRGGHHQRERARRRGGRGRRVRVRLRLPRQHLQALPVLVGGGRPRVAGGRAPDELLGEEPERLVLVALDQPALAELPQEPLPDVDASAAGCNCGPP